MRKETEELCLGSIERMPEWFQTKQGSNGSNAHYEKDNGKVLLMGTGPLYVFY